MTNTFYAPYGHKQIKFHLPDGLSADLVQPNAYPASPTPGLLVEQSLEKLTGGGSMEQYRGVRTVAIAVNDKTRPVPHDIILPPLLAKLHEIGVSDEDILFLIATGTHRPMPPEEYSLVLPEDIIRRCRVESHDCDDSASLVYLGETPRRTPVWINRRFMEADLRIVIGNIEPHHFMGFSGGVKSAGIGLAGRETITANHKFLLDPNARTGLYAENPVRMDLEDIGRLIHVHLAVNVVLNAERGITAALAGDPVKVMEEAIPLVREINQTRVSRQYDLVIASAGGHPKDINLYQAQKALTHAAMLTRDGGTVILAAACPEGAGSAAYEHFMEGVHDFRQIYEKFHTQGFQVGPHKAVQIARDAMRIRVILLSDMPAEDVRRLLLTPACTPEEALQLALESLPPQPSVAVMPKAQQTIPLIE